VIELGTMREVSIYTDDPRIMTQIYERLIAPDIVNSVPAKRPAWPFRWINRFVGWITSPFQ
jgi:hypothetical protein